MALMTMSEKMVDAARLKIEEVWPDLEQSLMFGTDEYPSEVKMAQALSDTVGDWMVGQFPLDHIHDAIEDALFQKGFSGEVLWKAFYTDEEA